MTESDYIKQIALIKDEHQKHIESIEGTFRSEKQILIETNQRVMEEQDQASTLTINNLNS